DAVALILTGEEGPAGEQVVSDLAGEQGPKDIEGLVARALLRRPGDWTAALRAVPIRLRRLYVNAYQAYLFNLTLSAAIAGGEDISLYVRGDNWGEEEAGGLRVSRPRGVRDPPAKSAVPLVQLMGYAFRDYGSRFDRELLRAARTEGVEAKQFFVEEMQEVSAEGGFRRPHQAFEGGTVEVSDGNATLGFSLGKGMYATVLLREVLKPSDPEAAGLG
ncbi:MAG TPA: tRNA pseudouridine(13) synthase TruD, partial [Nitrososphaerales archaeon]|nr:tRNA pseudouridine(13) synthase TruD [Nitrososphaerales archaeon]